MRHKVLATLLIVFALLAFLPGCALPGQEQGGADDKAQPAKTATAVSPASATQNDSAADLLAEKGYADKVLPLYIDNAKGFSQMAIAALALSIIFKEKVLGTQGPMRVNWLIVSSWGCFLLTIGEALVYQWLAIRLISIKNRFEPVYGVLNHRALWPGNIFGVMLITFYLGAALLVLGCAIQLLTKSPEPVPANPTEVPEEAC